MSVKGSSPALGLESNAIPDSSMTASTEYNGQHGARRGRLNVVRSGKGTGAWSARRNDKNQWLQVQLQVKSLFVNKVGV